MNDWPGESFLRSLHSAGAHDKSLILNTAFYFSTYGKAVKRNIV